MLVHLIKAIRRHGFRSVVRFALLLILQRGFIAFSLEVLSRLRDGGLSSAPQLLATNSIAANGLAVFPNQVLIIGSLDLPQCMKYRVIQKQELFDTQADFVTVISDYRDTLRW